MRQKQESGAPAANQDGMTPPDHCPTCGLRIDLDSRFCRACGRALGGIVPVAQAPRPLFFAPPIPPTTRVRLTRRTWFVILLLAIAPYIGVIYLWLHPSWSRRTKWILTAVAAVWFVLMLGTQNGPTGGPH